MKQVFVRVVSGKEPWVDHACDLYEKKIAPFMEFSFLPIKSKNLPREQAAQKKDVEEKLILEKIGSRDYLVLFDESGKPLDSMGFSKALSTAVESGKGRIIFLIGGAFGVGASLIKRADATIALSSMTMSHQVACVVALEQIYRGWTIRANKKYHNS